MPHRTYLLPVALLLVACPPPSRDDTAAPDPAFCDLAHIDVYVAYENVVDGVASECEIALYEQILDQREVGPGPWYEDTFVARIDDSLTPDISNAILIRKQAAVPEIHIGADGRYYLFYGEGSLELGRKVARSRSQWFATHGLIGYGALSLLVSDDGLSFEKVNEFEVHGLMRGLVVDPDVVTLPDGSYRMYYVGTPIPDFLSDGAWDDMAPHKVFYAESVDLVHWEQVGMAVEGPNADPTLWCTNEVDCMMASTGVDRSVSTDGGASFSFEEEWMVWGFAPEFHPLQQRSVRMYYNSKERGGALMSMISVDGGLSWMVEAGERLPDRTVEAVSLATAPESGWYFYYHYWQDGYSGDSWNQ